MERPYEKVPLIGLVILIENYTKMVNENFNMQHDLDQMIQELNIRFGYEDKQITIDEYMRTKEDK